MKIYKVRRLSDGLFSTGGSSPKFNKNGKSWNGIGPLKNHFNMLNEYCSPRWVGQWTNPYPYLPSKDFEVVEIELTEKTTEMRRIEIKEILTK